MAESNKETIERLAAELATANTTIESFKAQAAQASADETVIREKMAHGLTRDQAISVIHRQREHDKIEKVLAEASEAEAAKNQPEAQ
jgi:predicted DNA-binding WGR domain protein